MLFSFSCYPSSPAYSLPALTATPQLINTENFSFEFIQSHTIIRRDLWNQSLVSWYYGHPKSGFSATIWKNSLSFQLFSPEEPNLQRHRHFHHSHLHCRIIIGSPQGKRLPAPYPHIEWWAQFVRLSRVLGLGMGMEETH